MQVLKLAELTEESVVTVVEPLWARLLLLSVSLEVGGCRLTDVTDGLHGGSGADGSVSGDWWWSRSGHCCCCCLCRWKQNG